MAKLSYIRENESQTHKVEKMFNSISSKYDKLNKIITFGMDTSWRRKVCQIAGKCKPKKILDIATGTGDMAIMLSETTADSILAVDISEGMLMVAQQKINKLGLSSKISTSIQNAENLNEKDGVFDVASVVYGIRNFESLTKGLKEICRVLKEDGTIVILETSVPRNRFLKFGYLLYTKYIMPKLSGILSGSPAAYKYLSDTAVNFPCGEDLKIIIEDAGFENVHICPQFFGASTIYHAKKKTISGMKYENQR
ncbi:bifunctional demethylmenaquinone methyltransferase/2-methoxy-6-polyprenyl-1,4-benzoquinol methylase UbiE [Flavobacterium anhuiense]|uniref:bifunctional demethylmenaquinone methyltransferase/2-methoxy-6-polyprenyl-1,4-benzoquinol methylase UbiE n=1 Tax=Flavobacterium anhuiense TaxID=459526 RepID=UPI000E6CAD61|nr:bifunctional demethylmenaquinone methyltransferase/2-methoxy-6-polyprenyl-1,4-benzoquinol methylase UbiE [Flavobacterium anhuiense]